MLNKISGLRILICEDNLDAARTLAILLQLEGHDTRLCGDGCSCADAIREWRPDVAFLDIGMPGKDGYQIAQEIRADPVNEGIFIVAVTGYGTAQDVAHARAAGFDLHLTKPAAASAVYKAVQLARERNINT